MSTYDQFFRIYEAATKTFLDTNNENQKIMRSQKGDKVKDYTITYGPVTLEDENKINTYKNILNNYLILLNNPPLAKPDGSANIEYNKEAGDFKVVTSKGTQTFYAPININDPDGKKYNLTIVNNKDNTNINQTFAKLLPNGMPDVTIGNSGLFLLKTTEETKVEESYTLPESAEIKNVPAGDNPGEYAYDSLADESQNALYTTLFKSFLSTQTEAQGLDLDKAAMIDKGVFVLSNLEAGEISNYKVLIAVAPNREDGQQIYNPVQITPDGSGLFFKDGETQKNVELLNSFILEATEENKETPEEEKAEETNEEKTDEEILEEAPQEEVEAKVESLMSFNQDEAKQLFNIINKGNIPYENLIDSLGLPEDTVINVVATGKIKESSSSQILNFKRMREAEENNSRMEIQFTVTLNVPQTKEETNEDIDTDEETSEEEENNEEAPETEVTQESTSLDLAGFIKLTEKILREADEALDMKPTVEDLKIIRDQLVAYYKSNPIVVNSWGNKLLGSFGDEAEKSTVEVLPGDDKNIIPSEKGKYTGKFTLIFVKIMSKGTARSKVAQALRKVGNALKGPAQAVSNKTYEIAKDSNTFKGAGAK